MTAMTLVAALASFIFLPLSQALIDAYGWRDALLVLAAILAAITIPLHASSCARAATRRTPRRATLDRGAATRCARWPFWLLSAAFVLASLSTIAMTVFAIPFLLERGHSAAFAAFAVGLVGVSQIPGRLLFAPLAARLPRPLATASVFVLIALGIAVVVERPLHRRGRWPGWCCSAWATGWPRSRARPRSPTSTAPAPTARSPASPAA